MPDLWDGWTNSASPQTAPQSTPQVDPWVGFTNNGPSSDISEKQPEGDFLHPVKPKPAKDYWDRIKTVAERIGQYPRIFAGEINDAGETLNKVARGEIDAAHPDAIKAAATVAQVAMPAGEFSGTGAQIARRALAPGAPNPAYVAPTAGLGAAQSAVDIGAPLPAGIVSQTPGIQAATQGVRQLPLVGAQITDRLANTIKAAGGRVGQISEDLAGGSVPERSAAGANTRQSLQDVIEGNNAKIDAAYNDLRANHIDPDALSSLPRTEQALKGILRERKVAGMKNPESGLGDVANLVDQGTSFNGLQRARSDIGSAVGANARNPNPGFNAGDMKRVYAAMSADMEGIARYHAKSTPDEAAVALQTANSNAKDIIARNASIQKILGSKSDEGVISQILGSVKSKTGNVRQLAELRSQLPKDDFEQIAGLGISEMGHNPTTNMFSLNKFASRWNDISPSAKSVLIGDPTHRKALDDISKLGDFLKNADQYVNHSNTAHAGLVGGGIATLAHGIGSFNIREIGEVIAALAGGYGIGKILARPASASALRKWLTIAKDKASGRYGPAQASAALGLATRNLQNNLPEPAQAEPSQHEPLRVTVHPKAQTRAPSAGAYPPPLRP